MAKKIKNSRLFTFKAYDVKDCKEVLNNAHGGKFMFKSDCHYYTEKHILDFINNNLDTVKKDKNIFAIYKINIEEDKNIEDMLIELIYVKDDKIIIK